MERAPDLPIGSKAISAQDAALKALRVPFAGALFVLLLSFAPQIQSNARLQETFWLAAALLLLWTLMLAVAVVRSGRVLQYELVLRQQHYVQACMQGCVYAYWGWHWREVYTHIPHIAGQLAFAFAFDSLLAWSRRERWILGFGPTPIVLSTNLFLWFHDDWFALQFLMIAVGIAGKELITWTRDGRRAHIFNPSALSLWIFSVVLLITGTTNLTWGEEIATTLVYPEHIYLLIFLVGLVVQYLFKVTLTTLGAAAMLLLLNFLYTSVTGVYYFIDSAIPIAVFLGLHLLVTDPATSPRTDLGRLIFGALYGLGVFALYGALELIGQPSFYDKLLCVPILNLSVRAIERATRKPWLERWHGQNFGLTLEPARRNLAYMAVWVTLFASAYSMNILDKHHPGARSAFWRDACAQDLRNACRSLSSLLGTNCSAGSVGDCNELGVLFMEKAGTPAAHREALRSFEHACGLGNDAACANAAIQQLFHESDAVVSPAVLQRLEAACAKNDGRACYLHGYARETGRGPPGDPAAARADYGRGCDAGWTAACGAAGKLELRGIGGKADPVQAAASFERACEQSDAASCVQLALIYRNGAAPAPAGVRPEDLLHRACDLGLAAACRALETIAP